MSMTRKHYEQIAAVMQQVGSSLRLYPDGRKMDGKSARIIWSVAINELADMCAADNRNFDRKKFITACATLTEQELLLRDLDSVEF